MLAPMELSCTFPYENWIIKYELLEPSRQAGPASQRLKTVVFVHGTPWSSVTFQRLATALQMSGRYRVLLYDLPGYGQSQTCSDPSTATEPGVGHFDGDTSVKFQALALSKLLGHLQISGQGGQEAPCVIAHDIAGTIALRCLLMHHCSYRSLLLMDTNTVLPWGDGFYTLARAQPEIFCKLPYPVFENVLRGVIRSASSSPGNLRGGWEDSLANPWLSSHDVSRDSLQRSFVRQIAQANDADVAEMLDLDLYKRVSCPTKILWGEDDQWIPREKMDRLAVMLGESLKSFVVIPQAGHLIMVDQPERVSIEVASWLWEY